MTNLDKLKAKYLLAKNAYYNDDSSGMTDAEYDRLEDKIRALDPAWPELSKTGVAVANKKTEVALREFMPSLSKAYPEAIHKWVAKNPSKDYLVTDKLDGSALQVVYLKGKLHQVVTRGNGVMGGDITFLGKYLNLPQTIKSKSLTIFRCEAVISKNRFAKHWANEFDNGRNMVNGLLNRKKPHPALSHVDIVVLGCYGLSLRAGLNLAELEGLATVAQTGIVASQASANGMADLLETRLAKSKYEMDGLVVAPYDFTFAYRNADKPKNVVAFKVNADADSVEAVVERIIWQVSGRGRIIPKIQIKPTTISGVTVTYCTAHNAVWMQDRKIGPGAVVKLVRSGGVIPKIVGVTKPSKRLQLPDIGYRVEGTHFVVAAANEATNKEIEIERIVKFVKTLGIDFLAAKTIAKVHPLLPKPLTYIKKWAAGKLLTSLQVAGVGDGMSVKIVAEFDRVLGAKIAMRDMMVAVQCFGAGIGQRKLAQLEAERVSMNTLVTSSRDHVKDLLQGVPGFAGKTTQLILNGLNEWDDFHTSIMDLVTLTGNLPKKNLPKKGKLAGESVSFTGYRNKEEEAAIEAAGGSVVPFGSKTTILVYKAGGKASSKLDKARAKGVRVVTFDKVL